MPILCPNVTLVFFPNKNLLNMDGNGRQVVGSCATTDGPADLPSHQASLGPLTLDVEVFWGIPTLSFVLSLHRGCHHSRYFSICRNHFLLVISATWRRPCQYPKRAAWWTHLYMIYMASFGSRYFNKFHLIFRLFDLSCLPLVPC